MSPGRLRVVDGGMDEPTVADHVSTNRERLSAARRRQIDVLRRLAETEDQVAVTFETLNHGGADGSRRLEVAAEARDQASRLRKYADELETEELADR
jgi:hypothetical protein